MRPLPRPRSTTALAVAAATATLVVLSTAVAGAVPSEPADGSAASPSVSVSAEPPVEEVTAPAGAPTEEADPAYSEAPEEPAEASSEMPGEAPSAEPAALASKELAPEGEPVAPSASADPEADLAEPAVSPSVTTAGVEKSPLSEDPGTVEVNGCTFDVLYPGEAQVTIDDVRGCTDVVIPSQVSGLPVTIVGDGDTMSGADAFTSLDVPASVTRIGNNAFRDADALATLTLHEGLERIGGGAFAASDALTSLVLPSTVTSIGGRAFENATSLSSVDLGQVSEVGGLAFSRTAIVDLVVPASVTDAGDTAFGNIAALRTLLIEGDPSAFPKFTFLNSPSLESIEFHSTQASATFAGNIFQGVGQPGARPTAFFHDGAFGFDCDGDVRELKVGGATLPTRCLYTVDFQQEVLSIAPALPHVKEGTIITEEDVTLNVFVPFDQVFVGWSPALPHAVTADTVFTPVLEFKVPGDYIPSEDDLVEEAQGGFVVPPTVVAGGTLTLTPEPPTPLEPTATRSLGGEGGTEDPTPASTRTPAPGGTGEPEPDLIPPSADPEPTPDPDPTVDPDTQIDVLLFSEPVELQILDFTETSLTVQIPADVTPGEHKVAVYSVFGELAGWQPITVLAAPDAAPGGENGGGAGGEGQGGGEEAAGSGGEDAPDEGVAAAGDERPVPAGAGAGGTGVLASTGGEHYAMALLAMALLGVGGALMWARRITS
ncbi:leucine-rich repeat domain-containing protein [Demequina zhanjiangensis]|uniref:Leucine-rich repeat protein n=1 Tax=Demequina zhanjiangensis TaxID=3051659 RepID=A0ABT8FZA0_9MICO|nr:leucine-rich repeat protein [Demequina sp. SYSU T00b26]MDN4472087.1 leucine-rich repeat protein [Demequina sp. SYSU T00b26]